MTIFNDHTIIHALKGLGVYVTQNRIAVMKVLLQCSGAISVTTIRHLSSVKLDRVSVYRALQAFMTKGLILIVPNSSGIPHYMLRDKVSPAGSTGDAFLICSSCGAAELLSGMVEVKQLTIIRAPSSQFTVTNKYVIMEGVCKKCNSKND